MLIIIISPTIGAFLCALLFLYYCTFIVSNSLYKLQPNRIFEIFKEIDIYTAKSFKLDVDPNDPNLTFMQKINIVYNKIFDFINSYIFYIVMIAMLFSSLGDYMKNIESPLLKTNLSIINCMFILIFILLAYTGLNNKLYASMNVKDGMDELNALKTTLNNSIANSDIANIQNNILP